MSTVTGPFPIAPTGPGSTVTMKQPQSAQGQLSQLILDNLSTYVLQVSVGANVYYQAPLVESAYDLVNVGQPILVHAVQLAGDVTTAGTLAPTWYTPGEEQKGNWPIALSGPAEVAAAVAAALLEGGIPNVFTSTVVGTYGIVSGGNVGPIDVHDYASLLLIQESPWISGGSISWSFTDPVSGESYNVGASTVPSGETAVSPPATIPVEAPLITLFNQGATTQNFILIGTNRPSPSPHFTTLGYSAVGIQFNTGVITVPVGFTALDKVNGFYFQGPAIAQFLVAGNVVKGQFSFFFTDYRGGPISTFIADTTEMHVFGGNQILYKEIACPGVIFNVVFQATVGGAGSELGLQLLPNY